MLDKNAVEAMLDRYTALVSQVSFDKIMLGGKLPDDERKQYEESQRSAEKAIREINALVSVLPKVESEIIRLRYAERMSFKAIACVLHLSTRTVFKRRNQAIKRMVEILNRKGE